MLLAFVNRLSRMPSPWILLLLAGAAVLLLAAAAVLRQRSRAAADAAYIDELEALVQSRGEDFATLSRLSSGLGGILDMELLKRTLATELPPLVGTDEFWVVARMAGWTLIAGDATEPGGVVPRVLTARNDVWETFPLTAGGRTVGLMGIRQPAGGFSEERRRLLTTAAALVGSTIRNVHLFQRVRDLSMVDPLTRCLMRQFGIEALSREMRRMRRSQSELCVAILDLDQFKVLNDTHGHPTGDRALAMVGRVLREGLRSTDIACRYGGDEFLIVLPETSLAGAVRAIENLRRRIRLTTIDGPSGPLTVSVSAGVTAVDRNEEDPVVPIARADTAMYDAKRAGRNHVSVKTLEPGTASSTAPA